MSIIACLSILRGAKFVSVTRMPFLFTQTAKDPSRSLSWRTSKEQIMLANIMCIDIWKERVTALPCKLSAQELADPLAVDDDSDTDSDVSFSDEEFSLSESDSD